MIACGARSLSVHHGLVDVADYARSDAVPHIGAIRTVEPLRPHRPDIGRFIQGCRYDQAPVLPAGIAREREMHVVVAPNRVQVERLAPVCRSGPRGDERNGAVLGDAVRAHRG